MPVYSFGENSPLKFRLDEEFVASFNRVIKCITEQEHEMYLLVGSYLSGCWPFMFDCLEREDVLAYQLFPVFLRDALEEFDGVVTADIIQDNFLILNKSEKG